MKYIGHCTILTRSDTNLYQIFEFEFVLLAAEKNHLSWLTVFAIILTKDKVPELDFCYKNRHLYEH